MKVTKQCQVCETAYQIKKSAAEKSKFCSRECQSKAKLRKILLICERCGSQFEVPQCHADRHKFCSKKCRGDLQARFWGKVRKTDTCWLWEGASPGGRGYGQIRVGDDMVATHRLSWEMQNGSIPEGQQVLHECDTPACVNPDHLFLGTNQENMDDRDSKERQARGISHGMSKLTEEKVQEILDASGTQEEIAAQHGVSQMTISLIKNRKTWKHIERINMHPDRLVFKVTNAQYEIPMLDEPPLWRGQRPLTDEEAARTHFPYPREPQWEDE